MNTRKPIESNASVGVFNINNYICYNCYDIRDYMAINHDVSNLTLSGIAVPNIIERSGIYISTISGTTQVITTTPKIDFLQKLTIDDAQHSRWCKECGVLVDHRLYLKRLSVGGEDVVDISMTFFIGEKLPKKLKIKLPSNVTLNTTINTHECLIYKKYQEAYNKEISADLDTIEDIGAMSFDENIIDIVFDGVSEVFYYNTQTAFVENTTLTLRLKVSSVLNLTNVDAYDVIQVATYETEDEDSYLSGYVGFVELNSYKTPHVNADDIDSDFGIPEEDLVATTKNVLYGWGANSWGQLGTGKNLNYSTPILSLFEHPIKISIKKDFALGLNKDGKLYSWGHNQYGQLVKTGSRNPNPTPTEIVLTGLGTGTTIQDIQTGWYHSLVLDSNKKVWAVGRNQKGQLASGNTTNSSSFIQVTKSSTATLENIKAISTTSDFSLALDESNKVWKWGNGDKRAKETFTYGYPGTLNIPFDNVKQIATGSYHALALRNDGYVWALGYNFSGQLGYGNSRDQSTYQNDNEEEYIRWIPVSLLDPSLSTPTPTSLSNVVQIDAGEEHSVALTTSKKVFTWGDNRFGQIGDGKYTVEPIENNNQYLPYELNKCIANVFTTTLSKAGLWEFTPPSDLDINNYQVHIYVKGLNGDSKTLTHNLNIISTGTNTLTTSDISTSVDDTNTVGITLSKDNFIQTIDKTPKLFGSTTNGVEEDIVYIILYLNSFENVSKIVCGAKNTVAIKEDGTVWAWGENPNNIFFTGEKKILYPTRIRELEGKREIIIGDGCIFYIQEEDLI